MSNSAWGDVDPSKAPAWNGNSSSFTPKQDDGGWGNKQQS